MKAINIIEGLARKRAIRLVGALVLGFAFCSVGCAHGPAPMPQVESVGELSSGPSVYSAPLKHDAPSQLVDVADTGDDVPAGASSADILRDEAAKVGAVSATTKEAHGF